MPEINCPMCGKPNPAGRDTCQYCEARLKPLTDELSRSQPPIRPGEEPTEQDTGQLEPVLPQWLRDIRQQARESGGEGAEEPPSKEETNRQESGADLLAGLMSQSEDEDEIPNWLAGLRGEGGQVDFEEDSSGEEDEDALRGMLGDESPLPSERDAGPLPGWISGLDQESGDQPAQTESAPKSTSAENEEGFDSSLPAWLQDSGETRNAPDDTGLPAWLTNEEPATKKEESLPADSQAELPAWLRDQDEPSPPEGNESGLPAWLKDESPASPSQDEVPARTGKNEIPDWLASLGQEEKEEPSPSQSSEAEIQSTRDWLASLNEEDEGVPQQISSESPDEGKMPDWLSSLGSESAEEMPLSEPGEPAPSSDLPTWLASLGEETEQAVPTEEVQQPGESETPDWLSPLGMEPEPGVGEEEPSQAAPEAELPDWLAAMGEGAEESEEPAEELETSSSPSGEQADETGGRSTFVDDEGQPISTDDLEAIFSMDMPDWISDAQEVSTEENAQPDSEEAPEDELRPAELPSWVQAMRPVESLISETEGVPIEDQPVEERGPLAGLRGVLPAVHGITPSSKPKAYSIKLQASDDQMSSAALLERMLAEETNPVPVVGQNVVLTQRILRWIIAALLLLVVAAGVYYSPQISPIPTSVPQETSSLLSYIKDSLPANAPVLLVFDYEAARAGEMEATAAPLIDQMLTLKSPRLSLIASTPIGAGLAERFVNLLQADREIARNEQFVNLGYLPGGAAGVQAFAGEPARVKPLSNTGQAAWSAPVLQGVGKLSDFAAIVLLSDNGETARVWIEQIEGNRGDARLLVISSAQSAPMIRPYARSGQVLGMVAGLDSSAPIEQANSGRPGMARRYWDAYGFGLLAAAVMITIGSLWGLFSGIAVGRKERGKG